MIAASFGEIEEEKEQERIENDMPKFVHLVHQEKDQPSQAVSSRNKVGADTVRLRP